MKFQNFAFWIIMIFSLIGMVMTTNVLHELSHKKDYEGLVYDDEVCALVLPDEMSDLVSGAIAFYSYNVHEENYEEYKMIHKTSEQRAYSISLVISIIFLLCFTIVLMKWNDAEFKEHETKYI